jgi:hypothetical protein
LALEQAENRIQVLESELVAITVERRLLAIDLHAMLVWLGESHPGMAGEEHMKSMREHAERYLPVKKLNVKVGNDEPCRRVAESEVR